LAKVIAQGGHLPLSAVLRCRWRYFTDGAILGSAAFVASHRERLGCGAGLSDSPTLPRITDWGEITALHRLNGSAWG
jgi:putative transposase